MFKKTVIVALAALSLAGASLAAASSAQAYDCYEGGYRPIYRPAYRVVYHPVYDCGYTLRRIVDSYGNLIAVERVRAC